MEVKIHKTFLFDNLDEKFARFLTSIFPNKLHVHVVDVVLQIGSLSLPVNLNVTSLMLNRSLLETSLLLILSFIFLKVHELNEPSGRCATVLLLLLLFFFIDIFLFSP